MAAGRAGFHDTQAHVRIVIREAVKLIEWRASVAKTAGKFVAAMEAHNRFGIPSVQRCIEAAVKAADDGAKKRQRIRAAAEQLAVAKAARHLE
jgi:gamma-glutamyltranspeptidase